MFFGTGVSLPHSTPYIITGVFWAGYGSWTAVDSSAKGLRPKTQKLGRFFCGSKLFWPNLHWIFPSKHPRHPPFLELWKATKKVSLVRISTCHYKLCSPGNARTTSINRTFFQRVGSCNNSYLGSGFAAQSSGLPFRKHNVTRFSGGCANMARWFHISLEETLGAWDGLRLLISPERKPFLMTCVRCRRIASCWWHGECSYHRWNLRPTSSFLWGLLAAIVYRLHPRSRQHAESWKVIQKELMLSSEKHVGQSLGNCLGMLSCTREMGDPCKGRDHVHDINSTIPGARNQKAQRLNQWNAGMKLWAGRLFSMFQQACWDVVPNQPPGLLGSGHACAASLICNKARIRKEALRNRWLNMLNLGTYSKKAGLGINSWFSGNIFTKNAKGGEELWKHRMPWKVRYVNSTFNKKSLYAICGIVWPVPHSTAFQTPQHLHCCLGFLHQVANQK